MFNLPQNLKKFDILIEEPFTVLKNLIFLLKRSLTNCKKNFLQKVFSKANIQLEVKNILIIKIIIFGIF